MDGDCGGGCHDVEKDEEVVSTPSPGFSQHKKDEQQKNGDEDVRVHRTNPLTECREEV
jgi:hypothetical protein